MFDADLKHFEIIFRELRHLKERRAIARLRQIAALDFDEEEDSRRKWMRKLVRLELPWFESSLDDAT